MTLAEVGDYLPAICVEVLRVTSGANPERLLSQAHEVVNLTYAIVEPCRGRKIRDARLSDQVRVGLYGVANLVEPPIGRVVALLQLPVLFLNPEPIARVADVQ